MRRRIPLGLLLVLCLVAAGPAGGGGIGARKQAVDSKIGELQSRIEGAKAREQVLTHRDCGGHGRDPVIEGDVDSAQSRLSTLESVLAFHQAQLDRLTAQFEEQTQRLLFLQRAVRDRGGTARAGASSRCTRDDQPERSPSCSAPRAWAR